MICRRVRHGKTAVVFVHLFSKRWRRSNARALVAVRRRRNSFYRSKRHGRVNAKLLAWQRGTTQVGGSPFYAKAFLNACPLFSLAQEAQEKSLAKKKRRKRSFAVCGRRPTLRALDRRHLLEKRWTKTTAVLPWRTLRQIKI